MFIITSGDLTCAYLGSIIIHIPEQLTRPVSLISEMSAESLSVNCFCYNKAILCSKSNDADCITKEVLAVLTGKLKRTVDCENEERHLPVDLKSDPTYCDLFLSTVKVRNVIKNTDRVQRFQFKRARAHTHTHI
jgi:hypothetical protein